MRSRVCRLREFSVGVASVTSSHPDLDCVFINSGIQRRTVFSEPEKISMREIQDEMTVSGRIPTASCLILSGSYFRSTISPTLRWLKKFCHFSWLKRTPQRALCCMYFTSKLSIGITNRRAPAPLQTLPSFPFSAAPTTVLPRLLFTTGSCVYVNSSKAQIPRSSRSFLLLYKVRIKDD